LLIGYLPESLMGMGETKEKQRAVERVFNTGQFR
jgi:hypothetical protein